MKKNKYKILVLSDLKKSTSSMLRSTVSLAKIIHGDIHLFHVKKPADIIKKENQLSAMRTINSEFIKTQKKILSTIDPISKEFDIDINHSFSFGNLQDEILLYINKFKPDIIVIGKKKFKPLKVMGDNIIELILKSHDGAIMIANSNNNILEPNKELSIGILNNKLEEFNKDLPKNLLTHSKKPVKSFNIIKNSSELKEKPSDLSSVNTIDFVFEQAHKDLDNLSKYISKNNINLLCIAREKDPSRIKSQIKDTIDKLNVSMLLTH